MFSKQKRALFLNANFAYDGTFYRALNFAEQFARSGYDVQLHCVSPVNRFRFQSYMIGNVLVIEGPRFGYKALPGWGSNILDILLRTWKLMQGHFDVVFGFEHHPNVSIPVYLTKWWKRYTFISDWCDLHAGASNKFRGIRVAHRIDELFERQIRYVADGVTTISSVIFNKAIAIGVPAERVALLREGTDLAVMSPMPTDEAKKRAGLSADTQYVGCLSGGSSLPDLLDVFARIHCRIPKSRLLLIGHQPPGLRSEIQKRSLEKRVELTGSCAYHQLPLYLNCCDALVLVLRDVPEDHARFPHKIGDYLSVGKPVVITKVGDYAKIFLEQNIGLVADDLHSFGEMIVRVLNDKALSLSLGRRAREYAERSLSWQSIGDDLLRFTQKLVDGKQKGE